MANETPEEKKERKKLEAEQKAIEKKLKIEEGKRKKAEIAEQLAIQKAAKELKQAEAAAKRKAEEVKVEEKPQLDLTGLKASDD